MEKTVSVEERIRRAEEIYQNRINNSSNLVYRYGIKNKNKVYNKRYNGIKKMVIQIIVSILLYVVFYSISNNEYIFSGDFKEGISYLLNTQMDINQTYSKVKSFFSELFSTKNEEIVEKEEDKFNEDNNEEMKNDKDGLIENETIEDDFQNNTNISDTEELNIGGIEFQNEILQNNNEQEENNMGKSQMEIDAEDIKKSISFQIPVEGYISSTFGLRNPSTESVPKNHTGLDIAANEGTAIKSATDGTVVLASSYGDYGNHYKIQIDDVIIIYAHCKKLYLKEGDIVRQGQEIAEVGTTGNSTGPHLHFEIRKDGRLVDPQLILDI